MYIAQVYNVLHDWWRYFLGLICIIIAVVVGQIPFTAAVFVEANKQDLNLFTLDETAMMSLLESNLNLFLMLLSFAFGFFGVVLVVKFIHRQSMTHLTTSRKKIDWGRIWFAFIFWGVISTALMFLDIIGSPEDYEWNFQLVPFLILVVIAIVLVPLQTSFEEYLFRGYLMQGIGSFSVYKKFPFILIFCISAILLYVYLDSIYSLNTMYGLGYFVVLAILLMIITNIEAFDKLISSNGNGKLYNVLRRNSTPLIITSAVFGLLHIANPEVDQLGPVIMIYYIGTGLFLGIITLMDEGLELALGFHAANNLFTALLVTADWTAFQTYSLYKDMSDPGVMGFMEIIFPVFIIFPIVTFIFAKKYKWTDWSGKLFGKVEKPREDYKILE